MADTHSQDMKSPDPLVHSETTGQSGLTDQRAGLSSHASRRSNLWNSSGETPSLPPFRPVDINERTRSPRSFPILARPLESSFPSAPSYQTTRNRQSARSNLPGSGALARGDGRNDVFESRGTDGTDQWATPYEHRTRSASPRNRAANPRMGSSMTAVSASSMVQSTRIYSPVGASSSVDRSAGYVSPSDDTGRSRYLSLRDLERAGQDTDAFGDPQLYGGDRPISPSARAAIEALVSLRTSNTVSNVPANWTNHRPIASQRQVPTGPSQESESGRSGRQASGSRRPDPRSTYYTSIYP